MAGTQDRVADEGAPVRERWLRVAPRARFLCTVRSEVSWASSLMRTRRRSRSTVNVVIRVVKETMGVFYWIGLWSLIMPTSETNITLAWACAGGGLLGVIALNACDELWANFNTPKIPPPIAPVWYASGTRKRLSSRVKKISAT